jgi:hypothetical protein
MSCQPKTKSCQLSVWCVRLNGVCCSVAVAAENFLVVLKLCRVGLGLASIRSEIQHHPGQRRDGHGQPSSTLHYTSQARAQKRTLETVHKERFGEEPSDNEAARESTSGDLAQSHLKRGSVAVGRFSYSWGRPSCDSRELDSKNWKRTMASSGTTRGKAALATRPSNPVLLHVLVIYQQVDPLLNIQLRRSD